MHRITFSYSTRSKALHVVLLLLIRPTESFDWTHTQLAYTVTGAPCMNDCIRNKCAINLQERAVSCVPTGIPASIYFSAKYNSPKADRCMSNCGEFGYSYEWCVTTDKQWDYCSTHLRGEILSKDRFPKAKTTRGRLCAGDRPYCSNHSNTYYNWCRDSNNHWDYCAPPAATRIPILPSDFRIGSYKKGRLCYDVLNHQQDYDWNIDNEGLINVNTAALPDDYLENVTKILQAESTSRVKVIYDRNTVIPSYKVTVVNLPERKSVPVAIEINIEKFGYYDKTHAVNLARLVRMQFRAMDYMWPYNRVKQSFMAYLTELTPVFQTSTWIKVERHFNQLFSQKIEFKVLIVLFYEDYTSPVPKAIGLTISREHREKNKRIHCRGQIFFNGIPEKRLIHNPYLFSSEELFKDVITPAPTTTTVTTTLPPRCFFYEGRLICDYHPGPPWPGHPGPPWPGHPGPYKLI